MPTTVVLGMQWGDEGKGRIVDYLTSQHDIVARFNGGHNAGHEVKKGDIFVCFMNLPSGSLEPKVTNVIGNGCVVHLGTLKKEIESLLNLCITPTLSISCNAHLVFDKFMDLEIDETRLGTSKRGIGYAYRFKAQRMGLRVGDLLEWTTFEQKYRELMSELKSDEDEIKQALHDLEKMKDWITKSNIKIIDTVEFINQAYDLKRRILCEGSQATHLDIDHGTYPYVTSSNCTIGGVCTGLGLPYSKIDRVIGVTKPYTTRVGKGPFPTELACSIGERIRVIGDEYGSFTRDEMRCGWLDTVQVRRSCMINGVTELALIKLDVLDSFDKIKIRVGDESWPSSSSKSSEIKYITMEGWNADTRAVRLFDDLPEAAKAYVLRVEKLCGVPIRMITVGPERNSLIHRY